MMEENDFAEEIELADESREKLQLTLIDLEMALASEGMQTLTSGQSEQPNIGCRTTPPPPLESTTTHSKACTAHAPKVKLPKLTLKKAQW